MANLKYKTRGNISPQGIPRVYFCCHHNDFTKYFETISDDILTKHNCTIWYSDEEVVHGEDFFENLKHMQLFVMPVTTNILCTENTALNTEFKFAIENHIPVLPLMQENGLDELFNQKCGDLQFLNKYDHDITAITYEDKLQKYLQMVLVGDELADKIRAAFKAYVFLSYRKKDRKHAQELMKLIHKNDFCRDIAIWYDEFLTPGENFNKSIEEAIKKSKLFVLTVTPNIVNETNYIMTTEYPMAKREKKSILPIELITTDRKQLFEKYKNLPHPVDAHNEIELSNLLLESIQKLAITETDSSPEHEFFIGLAYLNGIDVEVDTKKAIKLIVHAAYSGLVEACEKLVTIYFLGQGVKRDMESAVYWQEGLLRMLIFKAEGIHYTYKKEKNGNCHIREKTTERKFEQFNIDSIIKIATNMNKLFEIYSKYGPYYGFDNFFNKYGDLTSITHLWDLENNIPHTAQTLPIIARRYDILGDYYSVLGNRYDEAISNINKSYKFKKKFCTSKQLLYERQKYQLKKLKLFAESGKKYKVRLICKKELKIVHYYMCICKKDFRKFAAEYHYYLAYALFNNGKTPPFNVITKHLYIAIELCLELQNEDQKTNRLLPRIYELLGMIFEVKQDYTIANQNHITAYDYSKKCMAISPEVDLILQHIQICKSLAIMCLSKKDNSKFEKYLDEIDECLNDLNKRSYNGLFYYYSLSEFWFLKGIYNKDGQLVDKSKYLYEDLEKNTKNKHVAMIKRPNERFGKQLIDYFN